MSDKKVIFITGCSSGFGYLTALKFARAGWQTFAGIRNLESAGAKELWETKKKENLPLEILPLDVTSQLSVEEAVQMAVDKAGRIDVLVNNAGFGFIGPVEEFSLDEVKEQYETNVFGPVRLIKAVAPVMRGQKSGTIVNVGSISGRVIFPLFGVYSSSKFALGALSEAWRVELAHFGIKVVLIEPGSFLTNFSLNRKAPRILKSNESVYKRLTSKFFDRYDGAYQKARRSRFLRNNADPQEVVDLIYKAALGKSPHFRYLVGWDAQFFYLFRKLLPQRVWEFLLHRIYGW